jgi:hypothetical protein
MTRQRKLSFTIFVDRIFTTFAERLFTKAVDAIARIDAMA